MRKLFIAMTLLGSVLSSGAATAFVEPADTSAFDAAAWNDVKIPLQFGWAPKDVHYSQNEVPDVIPVCADTTVTAWRGERIGVEALITAAEAAGPFKVTLSDLRRGKKKYKTPGSTAGFMRYVLTTHYNTCGYPSDTLPTFTVPDMIDLPGTEASVAARTVRPVWCTVEIPRSFEPGTYQATLTLSDAKGRAVRTLTLNVDVLDRTLPEPKDYAFYLDLWQQPYSIPRFYGVKPWSDEHFRLMEPYADMLGRAGQKTVSVILFYEPWGEQSNDKFEPMVETTLRRDGSWDYDYTIMDRYIEYMAKHGVDANISCFTMIPWDMQFRYFDEAKGQYEFLKTKTDSPEYKALWTSFLKSLAQHLKERGWYDKTMIVMDERGLPDILNALAVAQEAVPGIKMSLAGNYHKELVDRLDSYTLLKGEWMPADVLKARDDKGFISLLYTCCANPAPNLFSNSEPADGAYLPVYTTAVGYDGYLHWSFTNWTDNPLTDTRFHMFAPGDTYFVYPDGRSSIRYERLVEGVQMSEKVRLLREALQAARDIEGLQMLEEALLPLRTGAMTPVCPTSQVVNDLQRDLDAIARRK